MKTSHVRSARHVLAAENNADLVDKFDELVAQALKGDSRAGGAIAVAYGPMLLLEAERVLGDDFCQEAAEVLQDFFVALLEARIEVLPTPGRAVDWLCGVVRSMARKYRSDRRRDWCLDDER